MTTTTGNKCPNCGAGNAKNGKPFTRGTLALHIAQHCPRSRGEGATSPPAAKCCTNPDVRLLTKYELKVLADHGHSGFRKICDSCQEVM